MKGTKVDKLFLKDRADVGSASRIRTTNVNGETAVLNTAAHSAIFWGMGHTAVGKRDMLREILGEPIPRRVSGRHPQKVQRYPQILGLDPTENKAG